MRNEENKGKYFEKLVLGESSFGGEFLESENNYVLFKPSISRDTLAPIKNNKILWKKDFDNLISFDFARDGSYTVVVTQLTKKEMPKGYESGGHIYIVSKEGKIKDIKIPCDGLSCSISPDCQNFGITTMGPEWGVYYFNKKCELIWKKKFNKEVGGIELSKNSIVLYDKMHKETRRKLWNLIKTGK